MPVRRHLENGFPFQQGEEAHWMPVVFSSLVVKRSDGISVRGATSTVLPASDVKAATRLSQPLVPDPLKKVEPLNIGNGRAGDCFAFYIAYYTNINALK